MNTTEEEAKEKACFGTRFEYCVASRCMAWRWWVDRTGAWIECPMELKGKKLDDVLIEHRAEERKKLKKAGGLKGYCGLAGKP